QADERVGVPLGHAGLHHAAAILLGRELAVFDLAAGDLAQDVGRLNIGERFGAVEFIDLPGVAAGGEHLRGDFGDVIGIYVRDASSAQRAVELAAGANARRIERGEVLHEAVGPQDGVADAALLERFFDFAVP